MNIEQIKDIFSESTESDLNNLFNLAGLLAFCNGGMLVVPDDAIRVRERIVTTMRYDPINRRTIITGKLAEVSE